MEYIDLVDMIECLKYGTKLNIAVVFFERNGNPKTNPGNNTIHEKPYCDYMKSTDRGFEKCFKCRNLALKKAKTQKKPFGGFCFNGVYEYCHPVVYKDTAIAVIMIGNIRVSGVENQPKLMSNFYDSFEEDFDEEKCKKVAQILDNHIKLLTKEYSAAPNTYNPLFKNICAYIEEFIYNDISVSEIADALGYSDKHIGRIFKEKAGMTIHEYINKKRLERAEMLLVNTNQSITEISEKTGFNNLTYFNRIFKSRNGLTPREFRRKQNGLLR